MKSLSARSMTLRSTGVTWNEESLTRRYGFLRRIRNDVSLELIFYPYWLIELHGRAVWRLFGARPLAMLVAADARSGRCLRISTPPVLFMERLRPAATALLGQSPFFPAGLEGQHALNNVNAHVVRPLCDRKTVQNSAETFALAAWHRRCNLPLGPRADISCTDSTAVLLHKPFWIMTARPSAEDGRNKLFVFDASTGLGGVSEYWNVVEYVMGLESNAQAEDSKTHDRQLDLSA